MMCGDPRHNTTLHRTFFAQGAVRLFFFFFLNTRLWGNLKAQDLKGI